MHSSLVTTREGLPLGLAAIKFWNRDKFHGANALKRRVKLRNMMFGTKTEKIDIQFEQLEFELEDMETTQAEMEAVVDRASPAQEKVGSEGKPRPEHRPRRCQARSLARLLSGLRQPAAKTSLSNRSASRQLQGHPPFAAQVLLHRRRSRGRSAGAIAADQSGLGRTKHTLTRNQGGSPFAYGTFDRSGFASRGAGDAHDEFAIGHGLRVRA